MLQRPVPALLDRRSEDQFNQQQRYGDSSCKAAKVLIRATIAALCFFSLPAFAYTAEPQARFARTLQIPGSWELAVVAEGDFEPRSIRTYSLRIYGGGSTHAPLGDFGSERYGPGMGSLKP